MSMFMTPRWLLSHLFVVGMLVVMMGAGFWQLDRLDQKQASNERIRSASDALAMPIESLLERLDAGESVPEHTAVIVEGEFLSSPGLLVANRTFDTQPGFWFVAPLELDDGRVVAVSRGWIPRGVASGDDPRTVDTPSARVELVGRLFESVDDGRLGSAIGGTAQVSRMDLSVVEEALGLDLVDRWVQVVDPSWQFGDIPVPVPEPTLDDGPHLSYAFQWFFFSVSTVVAYALILRRRLRDSAIPRDDS